MSDPAQSAEDCIREIRAVINGYNSGEILDALIAFGRIRTILDSELPDSEIEWGWRYVVDPGDVRVAKNEEEARWRVSQRLTPSEVVKRRAVGSWGVAA